jgi:hypothetical protein
MRTIEINLETVEKFSLSVALVEAVIKGMPGIVEKDPDGWWMRIAANSVHELCPSLSLITVKRSIATLEANKCITVKNRHVRGFDNARWVRIKENKEGAAA